MAIKMVREPSETPNINNMDDIVPMRYAYGNQNGYVIGKGTEISNTVNGLNFTVNSGRLVLQGVECDIDASGVTITIDNIATTRYYVVYLQVNLGTNTASILNTYDTATYPTIDDGDDLTENTTGVARLPLYRFTATSGIISEVNKVVESIKYTPKFIFEDDGVLRVGNNIIPQKRRIWTGSAKPTQESTGKITPATISNVELVNGRKYIILGMEALYKGNDNLILNEFEHIIGLDGTKYINVGYSKLIYDKNKKTLSYSGINNSIIEWKDDSGNVASVLNYTYITPITYIDEIIE